MEAIVIKKTQNSMLRPVGWFFRRFHLLIFFVFIVACLSVAVVLLNDTLTQSSNQQFTSTINAGTVDQTTLDRIQALHKSNEASPAAAIPEGRINPFGE